jgi:hypothetical protein
MKMTPRHAASCSGSAQNAPLHWRIVNPAEAVAGSPIIRVGAKILRHGPLCAQKNPPKRITAVDNAMKPA